MKYLNLIFGMILISTGTIAQDQIKLIGAAYITISGDQLALHEEDVLQMDYSDQNIIFTQADQRVMIDVAKGLRIFRFEKAGIYQRIEYSYLLTDDTRGFLAEIRFLVKEDGDKSIEKIKSLTNYVDGYAHRD